MNNDTKTQFIGFIQEKGGYFGITGVTATSLSVIVAYFLYISVNPTFNTVSNCVSDLGIGPNMSNIVYNLGAVITGFCQIPFYLTLVKYLQNKNPNPYLINITKLTFVISAFGLILIGIIPFKRENLIFFLGHGSAAAIHYVAGSFAFFIYGFFEIHLIKEELGIFNLIFIKIHKIRFFYLNQLLIQINLHFLQLTYFFIRYTHYKYLNF